MRTDLLVIGAGPYAYSAAAYARERGIDTHVVGHPMAFWRDQMPAGMYLRSGPDWSLDAAGQDSFEAYFEDAGLDPADVDPIPIGVFLDHTDWFARRKGLDVDRRMVSALTKNGSFVATMEDGTTITADKVLAAPGIKHFTQLPAWYDDVPADRRGHTSELVEFDDLAGQRVAIIGGRQSAYEWAALLCDHGAAKVDVIHRHETPQVREGQLEVRRRAGRPDARRARLVAQPAADPAAGDRPAVLAGRSADAGVVAGTAAQARGGHQPARHRGASAVEAGGRTTSR